MEKTHLVIIDPQNDFCDPKGSLFVQGAEEDMNRLADFIRSNLDKIGKISITLDSHRLIDVAHPIFWVDSSGNNPAPFTIITKDDVENGVWTTKIPSKQKDMLDYVTALETNQRYPLCIWPPHCLIGSWGNNIFPDLFSALQEWESKKVRAVEYVTKGSNPFTEHYSAVKADVPYKGDPTTDLNVKFIQDIQDADNVLVAGEASSHCVLNTVKDIADEFGESNISKLVMMTDCMSPVAAVPGVDFPQIAQDFIDDMKSRGMRTTESNTWMRKSSSAS